MALKQYKPTTSTTRHLIGVDRSDLHKGAPVKALVGPKPSRGGRNNHGHITTRHQGGGHKKAYRIVDFKRQKADMPAVVERLEYDPNRTAFIALVKYADGTLSYILAPQRLGVGDTIVASKTADIKPGNAMPLKNMPVGTIIHNIELQPGKGGQIARSAGCYAQLIGKDAGYAQIRLNSGELRLIRAECLATIGAVSNVDHKNTTIAKAGRSRWLGIRPSVRGIAMNPVDHPHGGRTNGGRHPVTPWGQKTKGKKTRNNKRTDAFIVRSRHALKKI
ncbi:MAG: 50S ribosomal protein L2 [Alphaproteobacteria bacterium]|nr:50S ribosomal protein L2 [Alphaproteobacteria bacterium]